MAGAKETGVRGTAGALSEEKGNGSRCLIVLASLPYLLLLLQGGVKQQAD